MCASNRAVARPAGAQATLWIAFWIAFWVALAGAGTASAAGGLPEGFVYLRDVAPGIREDMRYAGADNFTGRRVAGYEAARCILAEPVARALARVQGDLAADGLGLKVFDCYRPAQAVAAFAAWARGEAGAGNKAYFPRVARDRIIALGYVATRSSHSLGTAVDLTLVRLGAGRGAGEGEGARGAGAGGRMPDCLAAGAFNRSADEVDMGTAFDCFDANSHTRSRAVGEPSRAWRRRLVEAMAAHGFRNYAKEWWHFSMPLKAYSRARDFAVR